MKKAALIKIFTLLSSVGLVTIFLLYRTGYFEDEKRNPSKELAQSAPIVNMQDTLGKDSLEMSILSSSKSAILPGKDLLILKTLKQKDSVSIKKKMEPVMFSSSKSGRAFTIDSFSSISIDSLLKKTKKGKQ